MAGFALGPRPAMGRTAAGNSSPRVPISSLTCDSTPVGVVVAAGGADGTHGVWLWRGSNPPELLWGIACTDPPR